MAQLTAHALRQRKQRIKEELLQQFLMSVDNSDMLHTSIVQRIREGLFLNHLLGKEDVDELEEQLRIREQQWFNVQKQFEEYSKHIPPDSMDYTVFQDVYNHVKNRRRKQIQCVVNAYNETHFRELVDTLWTRGWNQTVP